MAVTNHIKMVIDNNRLEMARGNTSEYESDKPINIMARIEKQGRQ